MKTCICLNNKNSDGLTAMEVLGDQALVISHRDKTKIQRLSRRKLHLPTARMNLRSPTLFRANVRIQISRITKISNEPSRFSNTNRYSNLQAALSPPGGVWQGTADTKSPIRANVHVDNTSEASPSSRYVGTTIMNTATFSVFWTVNSCVLVLTIFRMMLVRVPLPMVLLLLICNVSHFTDQEFLRL